MVHGKCRYNPEWEDEDAFREWVRPVQGDAYKASCIVCRSTFDVSNRGRSNLTQHAGYALHKKKMQLLKAPKMTSFFAPKSAKSSSDRASTSASSVLAVPSTSACISVPSTSTESTSPCTSVPSTSTESTSACILSVPSTSISSSTPSRSCSESPSECITIPSPSDSPTYARPPILPPSSLSSSGSTTPSCTPSKSTVSTSSSVTSISTQTTAANFVPNDATLRAEVLWLLDTIISGHSFNSSDDKTYLFMRMFPDSKVAEKLSSGRTKMSYLCNFGVAPYVEQVLKNKLAQVKHVVILFDEAFNRQLNKKQMDVHVRFWDGDKVKTRYLSSVLMGHAKAVDIFERLLEAAEGPVGVNKVIQLSMDGPNVNRAVFKLLSDYVETNSNTKLLDIGTCGLHTIHNAFKKGLDDSKWDLASWFSSLQWLFKDTPARREDFIEVTGCHQFPLDYCPHRWVENVPVAERAVAIWPHVLKFLKTIQLKTKSFGVLQSLAQDKLLLVKAEFFLSIAREVQPFLKLYQSNEPLVAYLASDLEKMLRSLMTRFVKKSALKDANTTMKLISLELSEHNLETLHSVDLGFKTSRLLKSMDVSQRQVLEFKGEARAFLVGMVNKLKLKSPLASKFVRQLSWLIPEKILARAGNTRFETTLTTLCDAHLISDTNSEEAGKEFSSLQSDLHIMGRDADENLKDAFRCFDRKNGHRLDEFYATVIRDRYPHLWEVVKTCLLLSHGQAQVERGFSVNADVSDVNMSLLTLQSKRAIVDYLRDVGGLRQLEISKELLKSCSFAYSRFHQL